MSNRIKRPPTVWLTQSVVIIFALLLLYALFTVLRDSLGTGKFLAGDLSRMALVSGFVLLFLITFWGLAKRRAYGKWLGVLSLIIIWFIWFLLTDAYFTPGLHPEDPSFGEVTFGSAHKVIFWLLIIISGLFPVLVLRLVFAKSVRAFFRKETEEA